MKINKIKINSYGKFKNKQIDLKDGINIIYGKNEAGKSTLLRFIVNSFYGISKNKKGKEYSDYERYLPWNNEEFSGNIEYELDNKAEYEIHRDFKKKNPQIYNEMKENISSEFNINKTRGNEFFYEQTKVDEDLFLSTVVVGQQELKLEKQQQSILVQKIANLIGTGEDNVSFKRAIDRVNRRQLDEVGTSKSREKPINIISRKIEKLEVEKKALTKYEDFKYDIEEHRNDLNNEILKLENKNSFLKEIKQIFEKEKIEKEKIKLQENIKNENQEKINSIKLKIAEIKNNNKEILENDSDNSKKDKKITRQRNKLNKKMIFMFIFIIIFNILQFIFIDNKLFNYAILASIPMTVVYFIYQKYKLNKKIKKEEQENKEKLDLLNSINLEINNLNQEMKILENNNLDIENRLNNLKSNLNLKINLEKEKLRNKYSGRLESYQVNNFSSLEELNREIDNIQDKINDKNIELHKLELDQNNIEPMLDNLSKIEEELVNNKNKMLTLNEMNKSFELAKEILTNAYERMKTTVTPKFTTELSRNISNITNGKYNNIRFNDEEGLIVELSSGEFIPANKLSVGTVDQLYLSLRLSMIEDLSNENMPIILDEAFAYFDEERLENILRYMDDKFKGHQIILLTCTNREKVLLEKNNINFNLYNL